MNKIKLFLSFLVTFVVAQNIKSETILLINLCENESFRIVKMRMGKEVDRWDNKKSISSMSFKVFKSFDPRKREKLKVAGNSWRRLPGTMRHYCTLALKEPADHVFIIKNSTKSGMFSWGGTIDYEAVPVSPENMGKLLKKFNTINSKIIPAVEGMLRIVDEGSLDEDDYVSIGNGNVLSEAEFERRTLKKLKAFRLYIAEFDKFVKSVDVEFPTCLEEPVGLNLLVHFYEELKKDIGCLYKKFSEDVQLDEEEGETAITSEYFSDERCLTEYSPDEEEQKETEIIEDEYIARMQGEACAKALTGNLSESSEETEITSEFFSDDDLVTYGEEETEIARMQEEMSEEKKVQMLEDKQKRKELSNIRKREESEILTRQRIERETETAWLDQEPIEAQSSCFLSDALVVCEEDIDAYKLDKKVRLAIQILESMESNAKKKLRDINILNMVRNKTFAEENITEDTFKGHSILKLGSALLSTDKMRRQLEHWQDYDYLDHVSNVLRATIKLKQQDA